MCISILILICVLIICTHCRTSNFLITLSWAFYQVQKPSHWDCCSPINYLSCWLYIAGANLWNSFYRPLYQCELKFGAVGNNSASYGWVNITLFFKDFPKVDRALIFMQIFDTLDGIMWKYLCVTTSCEEDLIIGGSAQSNLELKLCANFSMI